MPAWRNSAHVSNTSVGASAIAPLTNPVPDPCIAAVTPLLAAVLLISSSVISLLNTLVGILDNPSVHLSAKKPIGAVTAAHPAAAAVSNSSGASFSSPWVFIKLPNCCSP